MSYDSIAHLLLSAEVKQAIEWIMCNLGGPYAADSVAAALAVGADSDVLRENTEAVVAACDAAQERWAKLLGMTNIKAVLDQEAWVDVDVPDGFLVIVTSLFCSEALGTENLDTVHGSTETSYTEVATSNNSSHVVDTGPSFTEQHINRTDSTELSTDMTGKDKSTYAPGAEKNKADVTNSVAQNSHSNMKERGKSTSKTILCKGVGFHMVNWLVSLFHSSFFFPFLYLLVSFSCYMSANTLFFVMLMLYLEFCSVVGLILMKMLSEYIDMSNFVSSEVILRGCSLLLFIDMSACSWLQVSGLKLITSKHLALASQVISFAYAIIRGKFIFLKVPETRKAMLLSEIDQLAQDYKVHRDEIYTKLVQIM
ncbi:putative vps54-likeVacuolar protein sorting-associated protein [Rosa chinensis]|uniref:Putative vps54-likeVacuolar protein sorting-associated protein n=1 Tax=Rosa chinensis TaxID=74649 RepID=A0A2P6PHZ3_ROSCH|nr:putative vps54-likeVacuolar protein sorting-associated protein [Rosa chinensis]